MRLGSPAEAADALRAGLLAVIPTETVYGLAANALDPDAVARVFAAKGRPAENPLIVHVLDQARAAELTAAWPSIAEACASAFWPGPLTLVLPKAERVPSIVTGGLPTVALRAPAHPIAREIIALADVPLAAPSANRFGGISPTRTEHLEAELLAHVEIVVEGGACSVGIESTVIELLDEPRLLRAGGVDRSELEAIIGRPLGSPSDGPKRSPGMYMKHYAPRSGLTLVRRLEPEQPGFTFGPPGGPHQIALPSDPGACAQALYHVLHALDARGEPFFGEWPPDEPAWEAIRDRIRRAAAGGSRGAGDR
jgi:L-threonylcarbamoyladenylate synthase